MLLVLFFPLGASAGCGSTTTTTAGEPFPQFEGLWVTDDDTSALHCPQEVGLETVPFSVWGNSITMSAGVLTDLVETNGTCRFGYEVDVAKNMATLVNPDPYTGMAPTCTLSASSGGNVVLTPTTTTSPWVFNLLAPVKGMAPTAQLVGVAAATVTIADSITGDLSTLSPCMFVAQVNLHQYAKP